MTTAAMLYQPDAAWQSPRPMTDPTAKGDPPAVEVPHEVVPQAVTPLLPAWRRILEANGIAVIALIGAVIAFGDLKGDVRVLAQRVDTLEKTVDRVRDKVGSLSQSDPDPSSSGAPGNSVGVVPALSAAPQVPPDPSAGPSLSSPSGLRGFPSNVPATSPPECVSSKTFNRMPCEEAATRSCRGLNSFAPERYREIRTKAGVGDYMLVCDEKTP